MVFFDLSIPYIHGKTPAAASSSKSTRTKLATKAMELGYTGIAYNRLIKGVMSDKDICTIPRLTVSSLVKLSPSISSSVAFHRDLLGVPRASPFRQYTRLTVMVETGAQGQALNSGNPVLKGYDVVAVRPLNQSAFDYACERAEVDLISIDFSDKMPFRLKLPMVKAAIQRGVYFEITYSDLIMDAQLRRQVISNAKLLVDWTRGKNLIISSSASSVTELRGPNDVVNLSSLLGLSAERAKAAISKNCRNLIANALKKKHFYKEAIRVELVCPGDEFNPDQPFTGDFLKWDPLSSGEGDLLLDDLAKAFNAASAAPKAGKGIDFASAVDSMPSHGFQVRDILSNFRSEPRPPAKVEDLPSANDVAAVPMPTNQLPEKSLTVPPSSDSPPLETHISSGNGSKEVEKILIVEEEAFTLEKCTSRPESAPVFEVEEVAFLTLAKGTELDTGSNASAPVSLGSMGNSPSCIENRSPKDFDVNLNAKTAAVNKFMMDMDKKDEQGSSFLALHDLPLHRHAEEKHVSELRDDKVAGDLTMSQESYEKMEVDGSLATNHELPEVVMLEDRKHDADDTDIGLPAIVVNEVSSTVFPYSESNTKLKIGDDYLVGHLDTQEDMITEDKKDEKTDSLTYHQTAVQASSGGENGSSGKPKSRKRITRQANLLPFKHVLNHVNFKQRGKKSKRREACS